MHTSTLAVLALCLIGATALNNNGTKARWSVFKGRFSKKYSSASEEALRLSIWQENLQEIERHNDLYHAGKASYFMEENKFTDMTHEEFQLTVLAKKERVKPIKSNVHDPAEDLNLPNFVDWRQLGYVTYVKDQGPCGSCYAFAATGALEGQYFAATGRLVDLSESNLLDCSRPFGNQGCGGGLMDNAFEYILANRGIDTQESYPYHPVERRCGFTRAGVGATLWGYRYVTQYSETALQQAVARIGPISVGINSGSLQHYGGGVFNDPRCDPALLDHAVLVVGYGYDYYTRLDYWIVKNSWGEVWGERGYVRMARNKKNQCGIASYAVYPIV